MKHNFKFEFSPNLIVLLGEQLIHDKKIAISELVKNSYDADADWVNIDINKNSITIYDNGCGMDIDTIKNIWLKPGISSKDNIKTGNLTPKHKRMPIGEKGVGRLGSHKLGNIIEVYTRSYNEDTFSYNNEIHFKINWRDIETTKSHDELIPTEVYDLSEPSIFKDSTGTKIVISSLKDDWDEKDYNALSSDLTNLITPFAGSSDRFQINFKKDGELFKNNLMQEVESIKKNALFKFKIILEDGYIETFDYDFSPWSGLEKVSERSIDAEKNKTLLSKIIGGNNSYLSLEKKIDTYQKVNIGTIKFEGVIYDYDNTLWNIQTQIDRTDKQKIKNYMKSNGGVRVYRDNFRVFNYGEPGNDILDLDLARVNRPAGKISSNQILAAIVLNRAQSTDLVEKTNREGFINNSALKLLQDSLSEVINIINVFRQEDKSKIIKVYLENAQDRAGVEKKIDQIQQLVEKSEIDENTKKKINSELSNFAKDFDHTKKVFLSAATTGLSLAIVVHEINHLLKKLNLDIGKTDWKAVIATTKLLQALVTNYSNIIRLDKKNDEILIADLVNIARFNVEQRFIHHKVNVTIDIPKDLSCSVKKNLVAGALTNLFDNSLYWLDYQGIENKKIIVSAYEKDGQIHLVIADNGLGFTISFESALMPFVTGRKDDSSMGIGLYLTEQILIAHQGLLVQGDFEEEKLPSEFKDGAIIKLIFRG